MEKYKVGDKAIVINDNNRSTFQDGDEIIIKEFLWFSDGFKTNAYRAVNRFNKCMVVLESDLKPVEELPIPRKVMVRDYYSWHELTLYHILPDNFGRRFVTDSPMSDNPVSWKHMKEIEEKPTELTMEQIQEKLGYEVKIVK